MESDDSSDVPARPQLPSTSNTSPDEDFILTLETLPELWDKKCTDYTNKYKRRTAYEKLLKIFVKIKPRATVDDVKKKINSLRSNYRRELKKIITSKRSGAGTSEVYVPKSWTFKYLTFLHNAEQPVSQIPNNEDSDDSNHIQQQNDSQEDEELLRQGPSQQSSTSLSSINVMPAPAAVNEGSNAKRKKSPIARTQNELLKKACTYLSQPTKVCNSAALVWSEKLEELDPTQKLYAEKAINDILFEAQLGNLNRYSVKINQSSLSADAAPSCHSSSPAYTPSPRENRYNYSNIYTPSPPSSLGQPYEHSSSAAYTLSSAPSQSQIIITNPASNQNIQTSQTSPTSPPPSSFASSTPLVVHTDPLSQQDSYSLHIPSPSHATSQLTLSEYNVGTLFAEFKSNL